MIKPGQVYRSCDTRPLSRLPQPPWPTRIKVIGWSRYGSGKVDIVTLTRDGREIRARTITESQLHDHPTTRDGKRRRTGYVLETP